MLVASGVPKRDREDVAQGIVLGARRSVERGMYQPDPAEPARKALRRWIAGVAWKHAGHYLDSAWVRRAVLCPEPLGLLRELAGPSLHAQVEAREVLTVLVDLPPWQLEALLVVDEPETLVAWAKARGMNPRTAASRLRSARETLSLLLRRRG
ncbi:sigma-70 family RNA polymerase sigma factor [Sorangium sp. So ce1014]|uniref:sigma-70 family RNA polymerase sigma factor n=1 Tax=Sorangium sp. So ce1014 TaxID=3133326 RepID=UPI003F5E80E0